MVSLTLTLTLSQGDRRVHHVTSYVSSTQKSGPSCALSRIASIMALCSSLASCTRAHLASSSSFCSRTSSSCVVSLLLAFLRQPPTPIAVLRPRLILLRSAICFAVGVDSAFLRRSIV